ncbi:MAG TPA: hypothetical protein DEP48_02920 [Persephonella sp.]|uniref:Uncharacterized protein n=1 Tax=Persephonella marina (strain DSM 14350 / EX-H1) TaxID=123214 RepID=C0QSA1_PERMH|nr:MULTISPECIES: hypothetical protein [Persephonella]ACO04515.1 hypothetical protein PERMA_1784 [Persephonella marina EX-H1]HCB69290.1 hypothetical protein [Persephonella sp.]
MELDIQYQGQTFTFRFSTPSEKDINAFIELNRKGKTEKASKVLVFSAVDPRDRTKLKDSPELVRDRVAVIIGQHLGLTEEDPYIEDEKLYVPVYDPELEIEMFEEFTLKSFNYEKTKEMLKNARGIKLVEKMKEAIIDSVEESQKMKNVLESFPLIAIRIFPVLVKTIEDEVKAEIKKSESLQQK